MVVSIDDLVPKISSFAASISFLKRNHSRVYPRRRAPSGCILVDVRYRWIIGKQRRFLRRFHLFALTQIEFHTFIAFLPQARRVHLTHVLFDGILFPFLQRRSVSLYSLRNSRRPTVGLCPVEPNLLGRGSLLMFSRSWSSSISVDLQEKK